jgi:uncharacterized membrane protein YecN with MAPEG domain
MNTVLVATLSAAAAAAVINIWLSIRIGQLRTKLKISVGDGGNELLQRRMRAQLNFAENTPVVLVMLAAIEFARLGNPYLLYIGAIYSIGRVLHGLGMDGGSFGIGRTIGTLITMLTQLGLAIWGILIVSGV